MNNIEQRYERFFSAARELEAQGETVSLRAVRLRAGGGSMTDVCAAMQLFRRQLVPASTVNASVPPSMLDAVQQLYRDAQKAALEAVSGERNALEAAQQALTLFRAEIEELALDVENERDEALRRLAVATKEAVATRAELNVGKGRILQLEALLAQRWNATANRSKTAKGKPNPPDTKSHKAGN